MYIWFDIYLLERGADARAVSKLFAQSMRLALEGTSQ